MRDRVCLGFAMSRLEGGPRAALAVIGAAFTGIEVDSPVRNHDQPFAPIRPATLADDENLSLPLQEPHGLIVVALGLLGSPLEREGLGQPSVGGSELRIEL